MRVSARITTLVSVIFLFTTAALPGLAATLGSKVIRGAAVGYAVTAAAKPLDKFINTVTLRHKVRSNLGTKVVPILSVGEKGYIGGAQVCGPKAYVNKVKAVFQYEKNFSTNNYRAKVLVPSSSINPLKLGRVPKTGVSAIIDVALDGGLSSTSVGTGVQTGDIIRGAAVLVAVKQFGGPINKGLNTITFSKGYSTKVVPWASIGEKAYVGGAQVSGSASEVRAVSAVWQYEDLFDGGRFRIKVLVPTNSTNPLKMRRVNGAGVTAVIDMALSKQVANNRDRRGAWWQNRTKRPIVVAPRHDNGLHKGWYKGRREGRKNEQVDAKWREKLRRLEQDRTRKQEPVRNPFEPGKKHKEKGRND